MALARFKVGTHPLGLYWYDGRCNLKIGNVIKMEESTFSRYGNDSYGRTASRLIRVTIDRIAENCIFVSRM